MINVGDKVMIMCNLAMDEDKYEIGSIHEVLYVNPIGSQYANVYFSEDRNLRDTALAEQVRVVE